MILNSNGFLEQYYREIDDSKIIAGQELKMELRKLMADLDDERYIYDCRDADFRIDFMENCVKLTKSPFYGQPMKLMLWQKAFITAMYAFKMADMTYVVNEGTVNEYRKQIDRFVRILLLIARKNCKSETTSGLGLTELLTGEDGEDIVCSSNDDNQASIIYNAIDTMRLMIDPFSQDTWKNQQWIKCKINGSKVFKLSDRTRNKEGRNIDFGIVDEVHEMKDNVIVKSIEQSQSLKPNPKLILITTEGFVNGGFLDEELIKARKILNGEDDKISAERYLPWLYTQDNEQEVWNDEKSWYKSNPTLGIVKRWDYLRAQVDAARRSKADRMFTLSKDFNFKVTDSEAWLTGENVAYSRVYNLADFKGSIALGAVDLAETTDMCSAKVLMLRPDDNTKYIHSMYWIPQSKLEKSDDAEAGAKYTEWAQKGLIRIVEGNEVDVSAVADWFFELYKDFGVRLYKCGYDQRFAKEFLHRMDDYGFDCEMIYQNRYVLSSPMKLLEADIIDQVINYNDNEIDKWCLLNTSVQVFDTGHIMPVKIKGQKARRIDGCLTFIMCEEMYRRYKTEISR